MHVTKTRHVWRTQNITCCDVYRGKKQLGHEEFSGNVGVGRIYNMAFAKYGEGISICNIAKKKIAYVMDMADFINQATPYPIEETNLK